MADGPGPYNEILTSLRGAVRAEAVVLHAFNGALGNGAPIQVAPLGNDMARCAQIYRLLAVALRHTADMCERDAARLEAGEPLTTDYEERIRW